MHNTVPITDLSVDVTVRSKINNGIDCGSGLGLGLEWAYFYWVGYGYFPKKAYGTLYSICSSISEQ